jgi:hypothetical protein
MAFFMINFLGNIKRYQLYKKEKWPLCCCTCRSSSLLPVLL